MINVLQSICSEKFCKFNSENSAVKFYVSKVAGPQFVKFSRIALSCIRDVFRTQSKIYDGAFFESS